MRGLEGIKVVELTSYVAAPACPRILGEMGATIFKIEPASGDEYRTNGPGFGMEKTDTDDPAFDYASMNKTFVSINLKSEKGSELMHKMLDDADIMVTSFRDKALVKLGLDWESIHKKHPHLVWVKCAVTANTAPTGTRKASTQRHMQHVEDGLPACPKPEKDTSPSTGQPQWAIGTLPLP